MIKYIMLMGLFYVAYRLFLPKGLLPSQKDPIQEPEDEGFTDYEEVD